MITQSELKQVLHYEPDSGSFKWLVKRTGPKPADGQAGHLNKIHGYRCICVKDRLYPAHRLAWVYMTGDWPDHEVDHINMNRADNRWCNLREVTDSQNFGNQRKYKNNKSGLKGVCWHKRDQHWRAQGQLNGRRFYLGSFDCPAAAHLAYVVWADKSFGEYARYA